MNESFKFEWMQTTPMPVEPIVIEVQVGNDVVPLQNYAEGLHDTMCFHAYHSMRVGEPLHISAEDLLYYLKALLEIRVNIVRGKFRDKRLVRELYIPSFFQMVLSFVGKVSIKEKGIELVPAWNPPENVVDGCLTSEAEEKIIAISNKLSYYERVIHLEKAAMPFKPDGEHDLMITAVIEKYVCSMDPVSHGLYTYVCAFLSMKMISDASFKVLYRVQYDDAGLITRYLTQKREVLV